MIYFWEGLSLNEEEIEFQKFKKLILKNTKFEYLKKKNIILLSDKKVIIRPKQKLSYF